MLGSLPVRVRTQTGNPSAAMGNCADRPSFLRAVFPFATVAVSIRTIRNAINPYMQDTDMHPV